MVAEPSLVPYAPATTSGPTVRASKRAKVVKAVTQQPVPPQPRGLRPSRMEIIRRGLRSQGFSKSVSDRIAASAKRKSTMEVCDVKWRIFAEWCRVLHQDPVKASPQLVTRFLDHLFDDKMLANSTIEGYRTTISQTLTMIGGAEIGTNKPVSHQGLQSAETQNTEGGS